TPLVYHLVGARGLGLSANGLASSSQLAPSPQLAPGPQPLVPPLATTPAGFAALVIGPGGGRDLVSALVFGASHVDGVEINPIIADDVMRGRFREFSGRIYTHPRISIAIDDGRSLVRRSTGRHEVIQASLVVTCAATAAA